MPRSAVLHAAPAPETAFLVAAAADTEPLEGWGDGRAGALISVFAQLEAQDREARLG
jgi:phytoene synthase